MIQQPTKITPTPAPAPTPTPNNVFAFPREMTRQLSKTFRSLKCRHTHLPEESSSSRSKSSSSSSSSWSVYLILSTNKPIKTYVGVTTNFSRRLKQHNGELKGGAKASRAGRPWVCACIIRGFKDQSEACQLESKWKNCCRKLPRKQKTEDDAVNRSLQLLQHRQAALNKIRGSLDFSHLEIDWKLDPS